MTPIRSTAVARAALGLGVGALAAGALVTGALVTRPLGAQAPGAGRRTGAAPAWSAYGPGGRRDAPRASALSFAPRAARTVRAEPGATHTAVLVVANRGRRPITVTPRVTAPARWSVVTGGAPFVLAPGESDPWVVGVAVPNDASAGDYVVHIAARSSDGGGARDSVLVTVAERRALAAALAEAPDFAIVGREYRLRFVVRNLGNVPAVLNLRARSNLGGRAVVEAPRLVLPPGAARTAVVRVAPAATTRAAADVVELFVADRMAAASTAGASAAVTVVPEPGGRLPRFATVPAELRVRAAGAGVAVAPVELVGGGTIGDRRDMQVEFVARPAARGRRAQYVPLGQQAEYRLDLRTPHVQARVGHQFFGLSALTHAGTPGVGAAIEATRGRLGAAAHAQRLGWFAGGDGREYGARATARPAPGTQLAVHAVARTGATAPGRVVSARATTRVGARADATGPALADASVEVARSGGPRGTGSAVDAHLTGGRGRLTYDAVHQRAGGAFAGPQHGRANTYAAAEVRATPGLRLAASALAERITPTLVAGLPWHQRSAQGTLSATVRDRFTFAYDRSARHERLGDAGFDGTQDAVRVRVARPVGPMFVTAGVQGGAARDARTGRAATFTAYALSTDLAVGARQRYRAFADLHDGRALGLLGGAARSAGLDASVELPLATRAAVALFGSRAPAPGGAGAWTLSADARLDARLPNGDALGLRARRVAPPAWARWPGAVQTLVYVEYGRALRLPTGRSRAPGGARGQVVDAGTGRGVADLLVRVGDQAAVTDRDGRVSFVGLMPGEHPVAVTGTPLHPGALAFGTSTLRVSGAAARPAQFALSLTAGGRLRVRAQQFARVRTALGAEVDSLAEAGALENLLVTAAGVYDTLTLATGADGSAEFGGLPPGRWVVTVSPTGLPAQHAFERDRVEVIVGAGEVREVGLRLVPRRRRVEFVGADGAEVPAPPAGASSMVAAHAAPSPAPVLPRPQARGGVSANRLPAPGPLAVVGLPPAPRAGSRPVASPGRTRPYGGVGGRSTRALTSKIRSGFPGAIPCPVSRKRGCTRPPAAAGRGAGPAAAGPLSPPSCQYIWAAPCAGGVVWSAWPATSLLQSPGSVLGHLESLGLGRR